MTIRNLYRLASKDKICPRNFLQITDSAIIFRLHLVISFHFYGLSEQVVSNKSSLLQQIILQNRLTLKLFTKIIKTESIFKSY